MGHGVFNRRIQQGRVGGCISIVTRNEQGFRHAEGLNGAFVVLILVGLYSNTGNASTAGNSRTIVNET